MHQVVSWTNCMSIGHIPRGKREEENRGGEKVLREIFLRMLGYDNNNTQG